MKRKWMAALCLLLVAATLSACQSEQPKQVFTEVTQYLGPATDTPEPTATPATVSDDSGAQTVFDQNPYDQTFTEADAVGEENYVGDDTYVGDETAVETTIYPYAGSTPIPLDPVDAPSPTPRPQLSFTYVPYSALGLSFEAPAGWVPDESVSDMYTLTEPAEQVKEGQAGVLNIYAVPVNSNYSEANLKSEVQQRLDTIGGTNFTSWKPSLTASRYLMGGKGVYANYSGTLADGVQVGGRIHCTCIEKVLYCIQITYPLGYKEDYLNIFAQVRETIKRAE